MPVTAFPIARAGFVPGVGYTGPGVPAVRSPAAEGVAAAAFSGLSACSVGGEAFQLDDFSYREEPIIRYGATIGAKITGQGEGWIEADDVGGLAAALAIAAGRFRASGVDFSVWGLGGEEQLTIPASACILGGPHISFELMPGADQPALTRRFRFTVSADTASAEGIPRLATDTGPDHLQTVTWTGELWGGSDEPIAGQYQRLLGTFNGQHPFPNWIVTQRFEVAATQDQANFNLQAVQLAAPLPGSGGGGTVVDGEGQENTISRDEQMRLNRIFSFDLVVIGDPQAVVTQLRKMVQGQIDSSGQDAAGGSNTILREQVTISLNRHVHVKATFESLEGGNGNSLMNWSTSLRRTDDQDVWEQHSYPGIKPVLVKVPAVFRKLYQTGTATAANQYPKPPDPLYPKQLSAQPDISFQVINNVERQTAWTYEMWVDDATKLTLSNLMRPKKPQFQT
jgi:hypothetical protein